MSYKGDSMDKSEIIAALQRAANCSLATISASGEPRVRMINPAIISDTEIIFHTGTFKELFHEMESATVSELCFFDPETYSQIRVRGTFVLDESQNLKEELMALPHRKFLRDWAEKIGKESFYSMLKVYRLPKADAIIWTMATNNEPNTLVPLFG